MTGEVLRIRQVREVQRETLSMANRWLVDRGRSAYVTERWLELVCNNDGDFAPTEQDLVWVVPPDSYELGQEVDVDGERIGIKLPELPGGGVPASIVLRVASANVAAELFHIEDTDALTAGLSTRTALLASAVIIGGDSAQAQLNVVAMRDGTAAVRQVPAARTVDFSIELDAAGCMQLQRFATDRPVTGLWTGGALLVQGVGDTQGELAARDVSRWPQWRAADALIGAELTEAIRIDKPGGLGADAYRKFSELRTAPSIFFSVDHDGRLRIASFPEDSSPLVVDGSSFTTLGGRRMVWLDVPTPAAHALIRGARDGPLTVTTAGSIGQIALEGHGIHIQWPV
jgi:hypothetical protein